MNFFINLFKKGNNNNNIATFGNLVTIPKREDFNNADLLKAAKFKEEYSQLLSQNKTLTSIILHDNSLQEELNMNLELLMRISSNAEIEILTDNEKRIKSLITYSKLELYVYKIVELENEIKLKILALNELKKELIKYTKIRYFINRRNCINDEINNLTGLLCVLNNQKCAIYNKVNACAIEYKTIINDDVLKDEDNDYLTNRYQKLLEYAKVLLDDKEIEYANSFEDITIKVAAFEQELEIYAYTHSKDIKEMRFTLFKYNQFLEYNYLGHSKPYEFTKDDLRNLEIKFRVFDEFGKNIVTIEDLFDLYQFKFDYKTIDIYYHNNGPFDDEEKRDFTEYSIYGNIILEMIEDLKLDKGGSLSKRFGKKSKEVLNNIDKILTNQDGEYDTDYILNNNLVLSFLLAIHDDVLTKFFDNKKVPTPIVFQKIVYGRMDFEDELSLSSFYKFYWTMINSDLKTSDLFTLGSFSLYSNNWYHLTDLEKKIASLYEINAIITQKNATNEKSDCYFMPEGIKSWSNPFVEAVMPNLTDAVINKKFYTAKSLVKLSTYALKDLEVDELILNEGLRKLYVRYPTEYDSNFQNPIKVNNLVLPSTLEIIDSRNKQLCDLWGFDVNTLKRINFTHYKDSLILKNRDNLRQIFSSILYKDRADSNIRCSVDRITLWSESYYMYEPLNTKSLPIVIYADDIQQIIDEIATTYQKVIDLDYIFLFGFNGQKIFFLDKIIDRFIEKVSQIARMSYSDRIEFERNKTKAKVLRKLN